MYYIRVLADCLACLLQGKEFRQEFANLGKVRSLILETVHIMALTATATKASNLPDSWDDQAQSCDSVSE